MPPRRGRRNAAPPARPVEQQHKIVAYLREEIPRIAALTAKVAQSIHVLTELRRALISAAVTGKMNVLGELAVRPGPQRAEMVESGGQMP